MKRVVSGFTLLMIVIMLVGGFTAEAIDYGAWYDAEYTQTVDSAFSFVFVGDTQKVAYFDTDKMDTIYDWIVNAVEEKKIKFVAGLGDITDKSQDYEWEAAVAAVQKMDGVVPYSVVRGNHDGVFEFVKSFSYEYYTKQLGGMYKNILNTYCTVSVGTLKYLFLNLDHGPSDEVLAWAAEVIESHPKHNVIMTTHGYINKAGEFLTPDNSTIPPSTTTGVNDPPVVWDKLISKYENIVMVVCGHIGTPDVLNFEVTGDNGNKIMHVLVDHQGVDLNHGAAGIVTLFHFSEDGKQVQVEPYSTINKDHYGSGVTFELNSMGGNANEEPVNWPLILELSTLGATALLIIAVFLFSWLRSKKKEKK